MSLVCATQTKGLEAIFLFTALVLLMCAVAHLALAVPSLVTPFWDIVDAIQGLLLPTVPDYNALYLTLSLVAASVLPHNLYLHSHLTLTRDILNTADACRVSSHICC